MSGTSIHVLGAGAWGTSLAALWARNNHHVTLFARTVEVAKTLSAKRRHDAVLPGYRFPETLQIREASDGFGAADIVVFVTNAQNFRQAIESHRKAIARGTQVLLCSKGLDQTTSSPLLGLANELLQDNTCAILSGPSFAADVMAGLPTAVTLAHEKMGRAQALAGTLSTAQFRIYASDDPVGVEAGGALKNVLALAVGICRGLELGASAEAALISRGFAEMSRLAVAMGGREETLRGLSGLGDLVLTCSSPQSRNFRYGLALARDEPLDTLPLAEGVFTARVAVALAARLEISTPIMDAVQHIVEGNLTPQAAVADLLSRPLRSET